MTRRYRAYVNCFLAIGTVALVIDACGGRTLTDVRGQADGGQAGGGPSGAGGAGPSGTTIGPSGTTIGPSGTMTVGPGPTGGPVTVTVTGQGGSFGGSGVGGAAGSGGSSGCGGVTCPPIKCMPGYIPVLDPGACCPVCRPAPCNGGACPVIMCPSGSHLEMQPGQCCPVCVRDPQVGCQQQQSAYFAFRQMLLDKYNSLGCQTAADCSVVYESNRCISSCGTAIPRTIADSYTQNLRSFADMTCTSCPPMPPPPCPAPFLYCIMNRCTLGGPPTP